MESFVAIFSRRLICVNFIIWDYYCVRFAVQFCNGEEVGEVMFVILKRLLKNIYVFIYLLLIYIYIDSV